MIQNKNVSYYFFGDKKPAISLEKLMVFAAFAYPITGLPQMIQVTQGNTAGVSVLSWAGFALFVALFLAYSIRHRIKPMIITYSLWLFIDLAIVVGILLHR